MNVHASPNTLPELNEFLSTFNLRFRRSKGEVALERYLTGQLTELPNKNCDTMATAVPGTSEQRLHAIEQCHDEAKGELGWEQYQGRLWPSFHRYAVTVMLALSFLIWQELRERDTHPKRGRPRDPFSPSPFNMCR